MNLALMIPIVAIVMTMSIPLVWFVLDYHRRKRSMELHHAERMAAIERGMDPPALPDSTASNTRHRSTLLPGLIWLFLGIAISLANTRDHELLMLGFIPAGIGLAYLLYYLIEGRKLHELSLQEARARSVGGPSSGA